MRTKKILILLLLSLPTCSVSQGDEIGNMGRQFLLLPQGARESAMGGSFASVSDNAMGVFCNPAALVQMKEGELSLTHLSWFGGANEESAAYVRPEPGFGFLGGGLSLYWIHPFDNTGGAENAFSSFSYEGLASAAGSLPDDSRISIGGSLRYAAMDLGGMERTNDGSMDLGVFYRTDWEPLRLGAVVQNISLLTTAGASPPLTFRLGASWKQRGVLLAMEMVRMQGQTLALQAGGEYWFQALAVRAGLKVNDSAASFLQGSVGAGFKVANDFHLDYAASTLGDLGLVQWISMGFLFGAPERVVSKPASQAPPAEAVQAASPVKPVPAFAPPYRKSYDVFQKALAPAPVTEVASIPRSFAGIEGFPLSAKVENDSIRIDWTSQDFEGTPAAGYNIYISIVPGAEFRKLNDQPVPGTSWSNEMGLHGMTYYFLVKAVGTQGVETKSSEVKSVELP